MFLHQVSYKARCIPSKTRQFANFISQKASKGVCSNLIFKFQLKTKKAQAEIVRKLHETVRFGLDASTSARVCCRLMTSGATSLSEQMKQQWRNMTGTREPNSFVILFFLKFTIAQGSTILYW